MDKFLVPKLNEDNEKNAKIASESAVLCNQLEIASSSSKDIFKEIREVDLHLSYNPQFLTKTLASNLLKYFENNVQYYDGDLAKIRVYNKWHNIPRKQTAFGDPGLLYKFSGNAIPAKNWTIVLEKLKNFVSKAAECEFNFVLVNRYADGDDYIGEHRDDEKDLDPDAPIASLSLGQSREFVLRHEKRKKGLSDAPNNLKITLENGCLLLMRPPTNRHWYHSLPKRKRSVGVRVNLTFRKLLKK